MGRIRNISTKKLHYVSLRRGRPRHMQVSLPIRPQGMVQEPTRTEARDAQTDDEGDDLRMDTVAEEDIDEDPNTNSNYEKSRSATRRAWDEVDPELRSQFRRNELGPPSEATCSNCACSLTEAVYECRDCGRNYWCYPCLERHHMNGVFHVILGWKNGVWMRFLLRVTLETCVPGCLTSYTRSLTVVDGNGHNHETMVRFCQCRSAAAALMRYRLWPSAPKSPQSAYSLDFMESLRCLVLEGHVSVKAFCESFVQRHNMFMYDGDMTKNASRTYRALVGETFIRYLTFMEETMMDPGDEYSCPACPKTGDPDKPFFCMDACFGLVRKRSAGSADADYIATPMFVYQSNVDEYLSQYEHVTQNKSTCNNFKVSRALMSSAREEKLDEKAVFGAVCRHSMPVIFFNLKHGERFGYASYLIEELLKRSPGGFTLLYDVACQLELHLKKLGNDHNNVKLLLPIFHCYGHEAKCQMRYSPRRAIGVGLTDGENTERLWAYLRRFARITKEMTAAHRLVLLTSALLHYARKVRGKMAADIESKKRKVENLLQKEQQRCVDLLAQYSFTEEEVRGKMRKEMDDRSSNPKRGRGNKRAEKLRKAKAYAAEIRFLLELMAKYAHGQKIYFRLSKQIGGLQRKLRKLSTAVDIPLSTLRNVDSECYNDVESGLIVGSMRKCIDAVHSVDRCEEEIRLCGIELARVQEYQSKVHESVRHLFVDSDESDNESDDEPDDESNESASDSTSDS